MPHLFREDLEELEDIIKELSPGEYKLETKDFEYGAVQEIAKDTKRVNDFRIEVYDPYISLDFNEYSAYIYSSSDEIKIVGAIKKIVDVLSKRERKIRWFLSNLATRLASIFIGTSFTLLIFLEKGTIKSSQILILALIFMVLFSVIWLVVSHRISFHSFSVVEFRYKKDKLNFFYCE